jgi:hypothetical protein
MHGSTFIFYFIRIAMILGHFKFPAFTVPSRLLYLKIVVLFAENVKARLKVFTICDLKRKKRASAC